MYSTTRVRAGENHICHVMWTDEIGRPLQVESVTATLYAFNELVINKLQDSVEMTATEEAHIYAVSLAIPQEYIGSTLHVLYRCTLQSDASTLTKETTLLVDPSLSAQNLRVGFV